MRRWAWLTLVVCAWPSPAYAQRVSLLVETLACAQPGVDADLLRSRVELELSTVEAVEIAADRDASDDIRVLVREGCSEVTIEAEHRQRMVIVHRAVDLGPEGGMARRWALALLVVDLIRDPIQHHTGPSSPALERVEPLSMSTPEAAAVPPPPLDAPTVRAEDNLPRRPSWRSTRVSLAAHVRVYLLQPTALVGLGLSIAHSWLRVGLHVGGIEQATANGRVVVGAGTLDVGVCPVEHRDRDWILGLELLATGGLGYGAGRYADGSTTGRRIWFPMLGGAAGARFGWRLSPDVVLDAVLRVGFDGLGSDLLLGPDISATTFGPWVSLAVGGSLPL